MMRDPVRLLGGALSFLIVASFLLVLVFQPFSERGSLVDYADAAFTANSPVSPQQPNRGVAQVLNSTGICNIANNGASLTNGVTLYNSATSGTTGSNPAALGNGSRITGVLCGTNDTAANVIGLFLVVSSKLYWLASLNVPAAAGTAVAGGTPVVNFMLPTNTPGLPIDSDGNAYIDLANGDLLQVCVWTTAVTANKAATCIAQARDW